MGLYKIQKKQNLSSKLLKFFVGFTALVGTNLIVPAFSSNHPFIDVKILEKEKLWLDINIHTNSTNFVSLDGQFRYTHGYAHDAYYWAGRGWVESGKYTTPYGNFEFGEIIVPKCGSDAHYWCRDITFNPDFEHLKLFHLVHMLGLECIFSKIITHKIVKCKFSLQELIWGFLGTRTRQAK